MDQVTTFMDNHLVHCKRNVEDKILTKTMINNYAKNDILPPPVKKKYSKDHMIILILIYYYKYFLSISDIETLLKPLNERYFGDVGQVPLNKIYDELIDKEALMLEGIIDDITGKYKEAHSMYTDSDRGDVEMLQTFAFLSLHQ